MSHFLQLWGESGRMICPGVTPAGVGRKGDGAGLSSCGENDDSCAPGKEVTEFSLCFCVLMCPGLE